MARKRITEVERKIMRDIAENLKSILVRKGLTQKDLSELSGLSTSAVSDYLNEKTLMAPSIVQTVAEALNVQAKDINTSLTTVDNGGYQPLGIPLVGTICAGDGMLAEQNIEDRIFYPFPNKTQPDYALRVSGDSMLGAGIEDNDIVYLKKAPWAEYNGQIVAVVLKGSEEGMLKRIKWYEGSPVISLVPENDKYETKEVYPSEITFCGIYMGHFKPLENE